jgi:ketosteroid isomerase-like protein
MILDRRQLALPALAIGLLGLVPAFAASVDEDAVAKNVEAFRAAQVASDAKAFDALCAAELSYSHSDGRVEDKATFIANATNRKTKFLSLAYQDTKIRIVGTAAIVRFKWVSESEAIADGKKSATKLHILMNWQKQGADWKLLSRAATKL